VQAVQKLADQMASKGCDVLINNAGIFGSHQAEELGPLKGEPCHECTCRHATTGSGGAGELTLEARAL
jgi:NAD(P)-dependent dehydrogenase (short-subunit alcohol dehydrogenase family)